MKRELTVESAREYNSTHGLITHTEPKMMNHLSLARFAPYPLWCRASLELTVVAERVKEGVLLFVPPGNKQKTFSLRDLCDLCERCFNCCELCERCFF